MLQAIVTCIGIEFAAEGLAAPERATSMAQHYVQFRAGELRPCGEPRGRREAHRSGPFLLESKIEQVFDSARKVECQQMALANESRQEAKEKEEAFRDGEDAARPDQDEQIKRSALSQRALRRSRQRPRPLR